MPKPYKLVTEAPDAEAVIDNIGGPCPFVLTATWKDGKLRIVVEQPKAGNPWPLHEFDVPLVEVANEDDGSAE
jgi:hypothetical protein